MCNYRLYIFVGCGHSTFSETPVRYCKNARTRTEKTSRSTSKQAGNVNPAARDWGFVGNGSKGRDSQITLVPDNDSIGGPDTATACRGSPHASQPSIQAGGNDTHYPGPTSTTAVFRGPDTNGGPTSSHAPSSMTTQKAKTPPNYPPAPETDTIQQACEDGRVHPLHTIRLERMCALCEQEREERLRILYSSMTEIRIDPARWHWKYQGDAKKKDDGNQRTGAGWSVAEWWDQGKKRHRGEVT